MESKTKDTLVYKTIIKNDDDDDFDHESSFESVFEKPLAVFLWLAVYWQRLALKLRFLKWVDFSENDVKSVYLESL